MFIFILEWLLELVQVFFQKKDSILCLNLAEDRIMVFQSCLPYSLDDWHVYDVTLYNENWGNLQKYYYSSIDFQQGDHPAEPSRLSVITKNLVLWTGKQKRS